MAQVLSETLYVQAKRTPLHSYRALPLKITFLVLAITSRFIHVYALAVVLAVGVILLLYLGTRRTLLAVFTLWCLLSSAIILLDLVLSTLTIDVMLNLVYGFTTFTALLLFYTTTPPSQVRRLIGFNSISLAYLFVGYSTKLVADLIDIAKARGWSPRLNPYSYSYTLRSFAVLLVNRVTEAVETLRARGVEE